MPSVDDLFGVGTGLRGCFCIHLGSISADELHTGMLSEPARQTFFTALRQEIDSLVGFKVNQDCAVALALFEAPNRLRPTREECGMAVTL